MYSCNSSALQKKMVLFVNLLGKGLTQKINGREAPSDGLLADLSLPHCQSVTTGI